MKTTTHHFKHKGFKFDVTIQYTKDTPIAKHTLHIFDRKLNTSSLKEGYERGCLLIDVTLQLLKPLPKARS